MTIGKLRFIAQEIDRDISAANINGTALAAFIKGSLAAAADTGSLISAGDFYFSAVNIRFALHIALESCADARASGAADYCEIAVIAAFDRDFAFHIAVGERPFTSAGTNACCTDSALCGKLRCIAADEDRSAHVFIPAAADACSGMDIIFFTDSAAFGSDLSAIDVDTAAVILFAKIAAFFTGTDAGTAFTACGCDLTVVDVDAEGTFLVAAANTCAVLLA